MNKSLPPGWTSKSLGELLTKPQLDDVLRIFHGYTGDDSRLINDLKDYLRPLEVQLRACGMIPDYLAYALYHAAHAHFAKTKGLV